MTPNELQLLSLVLAIGAALLNIILIPLVKSASKGIVVALITEHDEDPNAHPAVAADARKEAARVATNAQVAVDRVSANAQEATVKVASNAQEAVDKFREGIEKQFEGVRGEIHGLREEFAKFRLEVAEWKPRPASKSGRGRG
jgi:hypothetical protein